MSCAACLLQLVAVVGVCVPTFHLNTNIFSYIVAQKCRSIGGSTTLILTSTTVTRITIHDIRGAQRMNPKDFDYISDSITMMPLAELAKVLFHLKKLSRHPSLEEQVLPSKIKYQVNFSLLSKQNQRIFLGSHGQNTGSSHSRFSEQL